MTPNEIAVQLVWECGAEDWNGASRKCVEALVASLIEERDTLATSLVDIRETLRRERIRQGYDTLRTPEERAARESR